MRFDCAEPEFPGAFVEFTDAWSVGEKRRVFEVQGEEFYALLQRKLTALHLPALEGDALDAPADVTRDGVDRLDGRLWDWLRGTISTAILELGNLGEAVRQRLYISAGKAES